MSTPFAWQGRIDAEETGPSPRWHQRVQPFAAASQGGVALIGFAVDEGVRRNAGDARRATWCTSAATLT
jgi:formiminoglutamase